MLEWLIRVWPRLDGQAALVYLFNEMSFARLHHSEKQGKLSSKHKFDSSYGLSLSIHNRMLHCLSSKFSRSVSLYEELCFMSRIFPLYRV